MQGVFDDKFNISQVYAKQMCFFIITHQNLFLILSLILKIAQIFVITGLKHTTYGKRFCQISTQNTSQVLLLKLKQQLQYCPLCSLFIFCAYYRQLNQKKRVSDH